MAQASGATVKVAVLGGGVGGLAAAFELSDPRHGGRFQVTLHQLGWRLGGKCASGRDMDVALRTKEHGPHIFFGFYDNAFAILREAYGALASDPSRIFKTIEDALVSHDDLDTMEQQSDGSWLPWNIPLPTLPGLPGDPLASPQAFAYRSLIDTIGRRVDALHDYDPVLVDSQVLTRYAEVKKASEAVLTDERTSVPTDRRRLGASEKPLFELQESLRRLQESLRTIRGGRFKADLATPGGRFKADRAAPGLGTTWNRLWILADLAAATALGMARDNLIWPTPQSVAAVNTLEYRAWLEQHGGADPETANSAVVRAMYDTVFAYPGGDNTQNGEVEAGSAVLTQKGLVSYRGPAAWKMRTGTGDVVAAPLFQVLQQRGVVVNFFHRVDDLVPSTGGTIDTIKIGVQATLKAAPYQPLITVKGLPAWPDRPLYDQLNEGSQLSSGCYDLESFWTDWKDPVPPIELSRSGGDFDVAVLAIPVGALGRITSGFANPAWAGMIAGASTVVTQSVQVWLNAATGWTVDPAPVVTGFDSNPIDTWLDGSEVIPYENWPGTPPVGMAILCGTMAEVGGLPGAGDHGFPALAAGQVLATGKTLLGNVSPLWPSLVGQNGFDWSALVDPNNGAGPARMGSQVFVPAINPWDQYVQTPTNNSSTRLAPDASGYTNLFLAGDWTDYGYNLGCFEGAVMSGLIAANAITKDPRPILRDPYSGT
jgi:uncharacterized protein with NAD-binding domain and iron-sulfur cluster